MWRRKTERRRRNGLAPKHTGIQAPGHAHEDRQGTWETSHSSLEFAGTGDRQTTPGPAQDVSLRAEQTQRR